MDNLKLYSIAEKTELPVTEVFNGDQYNSFETAYLIEDYPYGFLRTQMKIWVERRDSMGDRVATCTLNPKNNKWNKPKYGTYSNIILLAKLSNGHISHFHLTKYACVEDIVKFQKLVPYMNEEQKKLFGVIELLSKKLSPKMWEEYREKHPEEKENA